MDGKIVVSTKYVGQLIRMKDEGYLKSRDKITTKLQKSMKTMAKMGGLSEEITRQARGIRQVARKDQHQKAMRKNPVIIHRNDETPASTSKQLNKRINNRVIPCQINQWFASHPSDFDEIWHTYR